MSDHDEPGTPDPTDTDDHDPPPTTGTDHGDHPDPTDNDDHDPPPTTGTDHGDHPGPLPDTDELPALVLAGSPALVGNDGSPRAGDEPSFVHRHLTAVVAGLGVVLVATLGLLTVALVQLSQTRDDLDTARDDLARVEAGAALYASQVDGFAQLINELEPAIAGGLDDAVAGLRDFAGSTLTFEVAINETFELDTDFPLERTVSVPINTSVPINETFDTTITIDGPFGIDVPLDVSVPIDIEVPIDVVVDIPIDEQVPVDLDVPIDLSVPIQVDVADTALATFALDLADGLEGFDTAFDGLGG